MDTSKFLSLNLRDFEKGLIIAITVAVLTYLKEAITNGGLSNIDWGLLITTAILALIAYLLKNLVTNSEQKFGRRELKK